MVAPNGTKWRDDMPAKLRRLAAQNQYQDVPWTGKQIAAVLGISIPTLYQWYKKHPDLRAAAEEIQAPADELVVEALFRNCTGYNYDETKTVHGDGTVRTEVMNKHVPGNVTAQKFWLWNRKRSEWQERQQVDVTGTLEVTDSARDMLIRKLDSLAARTAEDTDPE